MRGEPMSKCAKCRYYCRTGSTFVFSHIGLVGLVVGYTIMGAFTFEALEAENELNKRKEMKRERVSVVDHLWLLTDVSNVLDEGNWTKNATDTLRAFETILIKAVRKEGYDGNDEGPLQWSFSGAILYSIIVITTIGYGNIAPKTAWGKIVTLLYAIVGIPLLMLCLSNIGAGMAHSFKFLYWKVCCYLCIKPKTRRKPRSSYRQRYSTERNFPPPDYEKGPSTIQGTNSRNVYYAGEDYNNPRQRTAGPPIALRQNIPTIPPPTPESRRGQFNYEQYSDHLDASRVPIISNKYILQTGEACPSEPIPSILGYDKGKLYGTLERGSPHLPKKDKEHSEACVWDQHEEYEQDEYESHSEEEEEEEDVSVPIWLCCAVVAGYICGGGILFHVWEGWDFLNSSYFCFITLTTIGFGDLVPGTAVLSEDAQLALGLCSMYLLFGMALIAMSFNLVQEEVRKSVTCIGKRIGIISDDDDDL